MCRQEQPVSPHFLIGPEGNVIQLVEIQDTARMEGQKEGEISILFSLEEDFSQAQLTAAASLFRMIREEVFRRYRLDLELDEKHIHWMDRVPAGFSFDRNRRTPLSQNEKVSERGFVCPRSPFACRETVQKKESSFDLAGEEKEKQEKTCPKASRSRAELEPLFSYREGLRQLKKLRRLGYRTARMLPFHGKYRIVFRAHSQLSLSQQTADALQQDGFPVLITFSRF